MRCPDCNKFVGIDAEQDPEVNDLEITEKGEITGTVRIVNTCIECGSELTEASFDISLECTLTHNPGCKKADYDVSDGGFTRTVKSEGKGRGMKTFYGAEGDITVNCSCGDSTTVSWSDNIQASHMESLV